METSAYYDGLFLAKMQAIKEEPRTSPKSRRKSDSEWLAEFRSMPTELRHRTMMLEIADLYRSVMKGRNSWGFARKYEQLKEYMKLHQWNKGYILANFGVSYKELSRAYFALKNSGV